MNVMKANLYKSILMGIVEGITEWLPISSTGHMILLEQVLQFDLSPNFMQMFRVVIQLGAISAVLILYFPKLWPFSSSQKSHYLNPPIMLLWLKILTACLPAAILGLLLDRWLDAYFYNHWVVASMLILYGVLFLKVDQPPCPTIQTMGQLTFRHALLIGLWQALSLIPGTSRSGATIVGSLLAGSSRPLAAEFTFYLAVPVMFGASGLKLARFFASGDRFGSSEAAILLTGMMAAFLVSLCTIRFLLDYVKKHSFQVFGWYRIALGTIVLAAGILKTL